jgi:hypothetical protein
MHFLRTHENMVSEKRYLSIAFVLAQLVFSLPAQANGAGSTIVGVYGVPASDITTWSSQMGFKPNYTIGESYSGPDGSGSEPCNSLSNGGNGGYPTVVANSHFDANSGMGDPNAAASGAYNSTYASTFANLYGPCAASIYALRLDWEWAGDWFDFSPYSSVNGGTYSSPGITPEVWIAGFRNMVAAMRSVPATAHIKVAWDFPILQYHDAANAMAYYPGDDVVDIISTDYYFNTIYDGPTSSDAWNKAMGTNGLNAMAAFAAAHNKPMAIWEWGDMYTDGYCITQFSEWIKSHNVVAHSYWDSNDAFDNGGTKLQDFAARENAYIAEWDNWQYTGTYWAVGLIPLPAGF